MIDARAWPFREVVRFLFFEGAFLILYGSWMGGSGFFGGLGRRLYGILEGDGYTRAREKFDKKARNVINEYRDIKSTQALPGIL